MIGKQSEETREAIQATADSLGGLAGGFGIGQLF